MPTASARAGVGVPPPRQLGLHIAFLATAAILLVLTVYPMIWLAGRKPAREGRLRLFQFPRAAPTSSRFATVLINSWIFAFGSAGAAVVIGVVLAVLVARTDMPLKRLARMTAILAFVSPPWLTAMAYVYLASPNAGFVNQILDHVIGLKLFNIQSMGGMIFVTALFLYSFVFMTVEAALASVDGSFEEAARVAGASPLTVVRTVTLPLVYPAIVSGAAFSVIIAWGLFAVPAILGMPARIYVFGTQLYLFLNAFPPRLELAAAMGVIFVATALVVGAIIGAARRLRPERSFAVVAGKGAKAAAIPLGRWRPVATLFVLLTALLSVAGPYVVVLWMSLNTRWFGNIGFPICPSPISNMSSSNISRSGRSPATA